MKFEFTYSLIFFVLSVSLAYTQQLTPPIHNYSSVTYEAASQNWDIDIDSKGIIYAANNQGLLSFDGQSWELHPLENGSIIRSVYVHNDLIYTGSYQEFGYWERDNKGQLFYTSLMDLFGDYELLSEEFWEILPYDGGIYFRSFGAIYKYKDHTITPILKEFSNKMIVYKDRLVISVGNSGLFYLNNDDELEALPNQEIFQNQTIIDVAVKKEKLLIGTRDALYEFDGERSRLYDDKKLLEDLNRFELNHIMPLGDNELVLATIKNGIIHYKEDSKDYIAYNRNSGLQNNTVLGMAERNGRIWLGLDNGIDRIDITSPIKFFTDDTGELGAVYDLTIYNQALYLGSNTGVYSFDNNQIQIVNGSEGHTWNLDIIKDRLIANHNTGTFSVQNNSFKQIEGRTGSFQMLNVPNKNDLNFIATYTGITGVQNENELYTIEEINFPVREIIFENSTTLWAAHPYEGIYKISLEDDLRTAKEIRKLEDIGGNGHYNANIYSINNQLAILNDDKWYRYNSFKDSLEVFTELKRYSNHKLLFQNSGSFWFVNMKDNSLVFTDFNSQDLIIPAKNLNNRLVKNYEKLIKFNDSIFYVTLNDGFARINLNELAISRQNENLSKPFVKGFADMKGRYKLNSPPVVPFNQSRDISIRTALPVSDAAGMYYELTGTDTISGLLENGTLRFQNLQYGDYELNLFALSPQGAESLKTSFQFEIDAPWYLSGFMKAMYILLFLLFLGLIYWVNKLKLRKQQLLLEQKFEKEHEERLNQLEKERLMNEINLKRKELANTTMVAAKKNEVLMEIQGELNKDKGKISNQFRLKHIMTKINKAIRNKDEWQVFETNFNEVHEDFFKDLLKSYPKLSSKDLKLCSYLKMNLSSKEIAPLMGISVRGVEVHRYRLRKKMDLDSKENLTNFLIKNF